MGQNPTEDELLALVMEVDLNGDGTIDFPEFLEMMKQKSSEADQVHYFKQIISGFGPNLTKQLFQVKKLGNINHYQFDK